MSRLLPWLLVLGACSFDSGGVPVGGDGGDGDDDGGAIDAGVDAPVDVDFDPTNLDDFGILDAPAASLTLLSYSESAQYTSPRTRWASGESASQPDCWMNDAASLSRPCLSAPMAWIIVAEPAD